MSREDRQLVGDLSASEGANPDRHDGGESVTGVMDAVKSLSDDSDDSSGTDHPYPETTQDTARSLDLERLVCPVETCDYRNYSSPGMGGHVPNAGGSGHSWDAVHVSATDLHELASRGTHPDPSIASLLDGDGYARQQTGAADHVARVRRWARDNVPVDLAQLQVYVHPYRQRVEIAPRVYLGDAAFEAFRVAMADSGRVAYDSHRECNHVLHPELLPGGR